MSQELPNGAPILAPSCTPTGISWTRWLASILSAVYAMSLSVVASLREGPVTGVLADGAGNSLTVKYAKASIAASTTGGVLVAAVTGKKIRVVSLFALCGATTTNTTLLSNTTALTGTLVLPVAGTLPWQYNPAGWLETVAGEGLKVTTGTGATVEFIVSYVEV